MKTIGHHTCSNSGDIEDIFKNAPFKALHAPLNGEYQFLGTGYYFWENNIELAKAWGKNRYNGKYVIIEIDIELTEGNCYDLVGNRSHQIDISRKMNDLKNALGNDKSKDWSISDYLSFMYKASRTDKDIFPYEMVRAVDLLNHHKYRKKQRVTEFTSEKKNYTLLSPKIVICVFEKDSLDLNSKRIIYPI